MRRLTRPALVLLALAGPTLASAQTTLRFQFKKGDKIAYVLEQKMNNVVDFGGKEITTTMNQTMEMTWETKSVDDKGNAQLLMKLTRARMEMDTPMGKVAVDSTDANAPGDQVGKILYPIIKLLGGLEFTTTMSPLGKLTDTKIPENVLDELAKLSAGKGGFDKDMLKQMTHGFGLTLPEEAVDKGKTWNNKQDIKLPFGKFEADFKYTYGGTIEQGGKKLEKIAVAPSMKLVADPNAQVPLKLTGGKGSGEVLFDNATGRLVSMNSTQTMNMTVEQGGQTLSMRIEQTNSLKSKTAK